MPAPSLPRKRRFSMLVRTVFSLLRGPRPQTFPALRAEHLPALRGRLEVVRDANTVAHIYAEHERDLYAAVGFLQGAERFTNIDLIRHLGAGRLCDVIGDFAAPRRGALAGKRVSDVDMFVRPLDFAAHSAADLARLDSRARECLEAFAEGVNAALRAMRGTYPVEYLVLGAVRPWEPADCLLSAQTCAFIVSLTAFENELTFDAVRGAHGDGLAARLYPDAPWESRPASYSARGSEPEPEPPIEALAAGSNNWAVTRARSGSGAPILANDPHVPLFPLPTFWHHVHLECERYRVQGGILPGCPVFGFGHNGELAWGVTTGFRDGWDLYRIHRLAEDRTRYRTLSGDGVITAHRERRRTRFGRQVELAWESCEHGVLYPGWRHHDGTELAVRYVPSDLAAWFEGHLAAVQSRTVEEYRRALARLNEGPFDFNHVYAHRDGQIGWELVGRLPARSAGLFVHDADDPAGQWNGFVPFEDMPKMRSPERGFVASANSIVDPENLASIASRVHFEPRNRQNRIESVLSSSTAHSTASFAALQSDVTADYALAERDALVRLLEGRFPQRSVAGRAVQTLATWDGGFAVTSAGAAIFFFARLELSRGVFVPLLGKGIGQRYASGRRAYPRLRELLLSETDPLRADIERAAMKSFADIAAQTFTNAVARLARVAGDDPALWHWSHFHHARLGTAPSFLPGIGRRFLAADAPFPGDEYTVSPSRPLAFGGRLNAFVGASSRFICDLSRPEEALFAHSSGPSGDVGSTFYAALTAPWLRFEYFRSALWRAHEVPNPIERLVVEGRPRPAGQPEPEGAGGGSGGEPAQ